MHCGIIALPGIVLMKEDLSEKKLNQDDRI